MAAAVAACDMAAERRSAAGPDGRDDLELTEAQTAGVGSEIRIPGPAKDICDLEARRGHANGVMTSKVEAGRATPAGSRRSESS